MAPRRACAGMHRSLLLAALLLLAGIAPVSATLSEASVGVDDYYVIVGSEVATGLLGLPDDPAAADTLVVILHGYGHKAESHRGHLGAIAERGAIGVAMDYRGEGFPLRAGADDTIAATQDLLATYTNVENVILYSVSMGTAVAPMVLAELPVFDHWIDNEGLAMLHETWAGATVLAPANQFASDASRDIEAECGGTPATALPCYLERSAATRAGEFQGLKGVWLTHGIHDGLVPYNQGREMAAALRGVGIPADFHTVLRGETGGEGTTITGYGGMQVDGLAGHGSESNDAHTLTGLSFGLLYALLEGTLEAPADREVVHDRGAETLP